MIMNFPKFRLAGRTPLSTITMTPASTSLEQPTCNLQQSCCWWLPLPPITSALPKASLSFQLASDHNNKYGGLFRNRSCRCDLDARHAARKGTEDTSETKVMEEAVASQKTRGRSALKQFSQELPLQGKHSYRRWMANIQQRWEFLHFLRQYRVCLPGPAYVHSFSLFTVASRWIDVAAQRPAWSFFDVKYHDFKWIIING